MKQFFASFLFSLPIASFLSFHVSCDSNSQKGFDMTKVSGEIVDFLGNDIINIIKYADKIESYQVKLQRAESNDTIGGYPVVQKGRDLVPKQIEMLQAILLDKETYLFDVVKKCLFLPEYAFRIIKDKKELLILVCFSCEELTFIYEGKELLEDFDNATIRMKALMNSLF